MQNAVCLLKIPLSLFACLIRQALQEEVLELKNIFLQLGKLCLWNTGLNSRYIPVHVLNEDIHKINTGITTR